MSRLDKARGSRSPEQLAAEGRFEVIERYVRPEPPEDLPEPIRRLFHMYVETAADYLLTQSDVPAIVSLCYITERLAEIDRELDQGDHLDARDRG